MTTSINKDFLQASKRLIEFIDLSPSPYHVVEQAIIELKKAGFSELQQGNNWEIQKGGCYYISYNSALIAFKIGVGEPESDGFRIISSHSDSPCFKVKPDAAMLADGYFLKLNTEVYGGPILSTWLDRPLSMAGRIVKRSDNVLYPEKQLINFDRPLMVIPNLAIHLNRQVNEGVELNKQIDMLPLLGTVNNMLEKDNWLLNNLAEEAQCDVTDIIDFDLYLYPYEPGIILGLNNEFISAPRLDNLAMVHASINALVNSTQSASTQMICIFDNEEVGSLSKQGAGSPILKHVFERIMFKLNRDIEATHRTIYQSFMISADMAHSVHPNRIEKYDPVLHPHINKGPVIKIHAGQKYTTDGDSGAVYATICETAGIPFQKFVNRSDMAGGSTLGNISTGQLEIRTVDVGNPMLAMHSARELAGTKDHLWIIESFETFFEM
jgi:aspartyl aminopeptidase